jgi:hypothetical protein
MKENSRAKIKSILISSLFPIYQKREITIINDTNGEIKDRLD